MTLQPLTCELCSPSLGRCMECRRCLKHCLCEPVGLRNHFIDDWLVIAQDESGHRWYVITETWPEWGEVGGPDEQQMTPDEVLGAENRIIAASKERPNQFTHDPQYCLVCDPYPKEEYRDPA